MPEFATPVALVGLKVEGDELLVPARAEVPEEAQDKEGIDPTQSSHRWHTDIDGPGPACLVHRTGVLMFNGRRIKVQRLHKTIRPHDEVQRLDISVLNNEVRRLNFFHSAPCLMTLYKSKDVDDGSPLLHDRAILLLNSAVGASRLARCGRAPQRTP